MTVWNEEAKERLQAAIIASMDSIPNARKIATLYGQDATVSSIENALRKPRKLAETLKAEADAAEAAGHVIPYSTPRAKAPASPKKSKKTADSDASKGKGKAKDGVKAGRVTKKKAASKQANLAPFEDIEKEAPKEVKQEVVEDDDDGASSPADEI